MRVFIISTLIILSAAGDFSIKGDPALGEIQGNYTVTRVDDEIKIVMAPST